MHAKRAEHPWSPASGRGLFFAVAALLAAGCAQRPAPTEALPTATEDGITYSLVRANVTVFPLDWQGHLGAGSWACDGLPCASSSRDLDANANTTRRAELEGTLLWHVNATMRWTGPAAAASPGASLTLYATRPCGPGCLAWRRLDAATGQPPLSLQMRDLALATNETGLALVAGRAPGLVPSLAATMDFAMEGQFVSLRPEEPADQGYFRPAGQGQDAGRTPSGPALR